MHANQVDDAEAELFHIQAEFCRGLAHPKRMQIISTLKAGEMSVSELAQVTGIKQANLSQHLTILRQLGILSKRRDGLNIFYSISDERITQACELVRTTIRQRLHRTNRILEVIQA
ncbi:MAG: metalloregulator ArsR/SmtB family transcription factor [Thaumarchaeota archaeon]|nr:metalloregulator ArsR/SmtB family transcription factor [Nitrososphaerota archaeon]